MRRGFLNTTGIGHPPETEILWHVWLAITRRFPSSLRVPGQRSLHRDDIADGECREARGRKRSLAGVFAIGVAWPFAFQYGRIAGWYTISTFLLSLVTWIYLRLPGREQRSNMGRIRSGKRCVGSVKLLFVLSLLLLADLLPFHQRGCKKQIANCNHGSTGDGSVCRCASPSTSVRICVG